MKLNYVIEYVTDMDRAVAFFRDKLGLELRFESPSWSEFSTGETTLALHAASDAHPAGSMSIGFGIDDINAFHEAARGKGIEFTSEPVETFGRRIARFRDSEGTECSVSGK